METKLKLISRSPTLQLTFKALLFAIFFALVKIGDFGFLPIIIFLAGAIFLYGKPLFRTFELIVPFIILLVVSLLSAWALRGSSFFIFADLYFAFLFYLILGVKDLTLIQRAGWYRFLNLGLVYSIFLLFFYSNQDSFLVKLLIVFLAILLLLRDFLKKRLIFWLLALLTLESVWVISLLPVGFVSSANLAVLVYFVLSDFAQHHLMGTLSRRRILTDVTIFILLTLLIFAFSKWSL